MSDLQSGTLVQHVSLGVGRVVAVEPAAVHVFFPGGDTRFAAKLRLPNARALLRTDGIAPDEWLAGLSAFSMDAESGRYALTATWLTQAQALEQFMTAQPGGFAAPDPEAAGKPARAARWRAAHEAFQKKLGGGELARLLEADGLSTLVSRCVDIDKLVAPLHPPADVGAVKAALADEATAGAFLTALSELVTAPTPGRARFDALFSAARLLPVEPPQQWLVATMLPFLASPDRHALLRPRTTCAAAERLGSDLRFEPAPVWVTYSQLRTLSAKLLERLAPAGATDFIDVEGFLHVIAAGRRPTAAGMRAAGATVAARKTKAKLKAARPASP
jgi:hypothetical protein